MNEPARLTDLVEALLGAGGPISFYDALLAARRAQTAGHLTDTALAALMALHDSPESTDGARDVLAEILRTYAARVGAERALAARAITLADSEQTARVSVGDTLTLALEERSGAGWRWEIVSASGGADVERVAVASERTARFRVVLPIAGKVRLALEERPPPRGRGEPEEPRRFSLCVLVSGDGQ